MFKNDLQYFWKIILFKCRDILRQAKDSGSFFEKLDMMLTLVIYIYYIWEIRQQYSPEVFRQVMEQVENFKENDNR